MTRFSFLLLIFFVGLIFQSYSQETCTTIADGNWSSASTWSCDGASSFPVLDFGRAPHTATAGDSIIINHTVRVSDGNDKQEMEGPVVLYIGDNGVLTDSSDALGNSSGYDPMEFKTKNDAKTVIMYNYGLFEIGKKFKLDYDDSLFNHDYLRVGGGTGTDGEMHLDGYICNTDTMELDSAGTLKLHGAVMDCGGVVLACIIEFDNHGDSAAVLLNISIDTCNSSNSNYNCGVTDYGPKSAQDSIGIPDSSKVSFCDGTPISAFALPITLSYFKGIYDVENDVVKLSWATLSEINNDYFTVLRSIDLNIWEAVGDISGAGNSINRILYNFEDENPMDETSYYQLKQTDYDGAHSFSNVAAVNAKNDKFDRIYPQPANDVVFLSFSANYDNISILNSQGMVVHSEKINNSNFMEIDVSDIASGVYVIILKSDAIEKSVKLVIQH